MASHTLTVLATHWTGAKMALKILKADEPLTIDNIVMALYSNPGLGKTTLGFSATKSILLDFDHGAHRAANRRDIVQIDSWLDVTQITSDDLEPYRTIVIDTAGRALDFLTTDIIRRFPKKGFGGALTLQGYGTLKAEFGAWLKSLRTMGKDIVLIAHSSEDKNGDDIIERLDVQGGSKGEIYKSADAMGRLSLVGGKRVLNFSPTDTTFGKNPGNLDPIKVPEISTDPDFLGGVINTIKERLSALTEEQKKRQKNIEKWLKKFEKAKTPEDYNNLVADVVDADESIKKTIKAELHKQATESGLIYDADKGYVEAPQ
jgi:hypothetical protein